MSRRKKPAESGGGGAPGWMTTFSDLMSLLLTFFILLFSMSSVSPEKFSSAASSIQSVFSGSSGGSTILDGSDVLENIAQQYIENKDIYDTVSDYLESQELGSDVSVSMDSKGVFVEMKEAILFEPGSADLKDEGIEVLNKLKGLINEFRNDLVIEGHTDDVPSKSGRFPTNWELSTARAVSVVRYMAEVEGIDPTRLSAIGYGEYRPMVPNNSSENRAINRRVNILIIFDEESDSNGS